MNCINFVVPMNPCPCGFYPDRERCHCTPYEIRRYLGRISGPILDRMDICVEAVPMEFRDMAKHATGERSQDIRERVLMARERQKQRFIGTGIQFNGDMGAAEVERYCRLGPDETSYMEKMFVKMKLSARAYHRILKVARTIADLADSGEIRKMHLSEAVCYRGMEHKYW